MKRCVNNHEVPDTAAHCPNCGVAMAKAASATVYEEPAGGPAYTPGPVPPFRPGPLPGGAGPFRGASPMPPPMGGGRNRRTILDEDVEETRRLMGWFVVSDSKEETAGRFFRLRQGVNDVGRLGSRATIELKDNGVSERHAVLVATSRGYRLVDLDSSNGILVNGQKTDDALLQHGDQLKFGYTTGTFVAFEFVAED